MSTEPQFLPQPREIAPGYVVPPLIIGLWQLSGGHRPVASATPTERLGDLLAFVDAGFSTFDCADIYTGVEEILGEVIRARPQRVRVHTKFVPDRSVLPHIDRDYVRSIIDRSLRRLGVERLDLVQFHWWDWQIPGWVDTAGWLRDLQVEGKIHLLGATNFDAGHLEVLRRAGIRVVTDQVQYSLLDRRPERTLRDWAAAADAWLLCYGTVAGGLLSERWLGADSPAPDWPNRSLQKYGLIVEDCGGWSTLQQLLRQLQAVAGETGLGIADLAIRAVLDRPRVAAAVVGAADASNLQRLRRLLEIPLPEALRDRIQSIGDRVPPLPGDVYDLERQAGGKHAAIMRTELNRQSAAPQ